MATIDVTCPKCGTGDVDVSSSDENIDLLVMVCKDCGWKWFKLAVSWTKSSAATDWFPYRANSIFAPQEGEWCLWSTVIRGERNYFCGSLVERNGLVVIAADGWGFHEPDETTYWTRVRYIQQGEKNENWKL